MMMMMVLINNHAKEKPAWAACRKGRGQAGGSSPRPEGVALMASEMDLVLMSKPPLGGPEGQLGEEGGVPWISVFLGLTHTPVGRGFSELPGLDSEGNKLWVGGPKLKPPPRLPPPQGPDPKGKEGSHAENEPSPPPWMGGGDTPARGSHLLPTSAPPEPFRSALGSCLSNTPLPMVS